MYRATTDHQVLEQVAALPIGALASYAELLVMLETVPWNGGPVHKDNPDGAVRAHAFGSGGLVTYLILEDQRRVDVLTVQWVGWLIGSVRHRRLSECLRTWLETRLACSSPVSKVDMAARIPRW